MLLKVSDAAKYLGVSISTMHRWEREGKIKPSRTPGGQRRYETDDLMRFKGKSTTQKYTIAYARVSSSDQKDDLERQKVNLENYCTAKGCQFRVVSDIGSGLNYNKKGLNELIESICANEIDRIVINYKDRLIRFGYEMLEQVCKYHGVKIEIINFTEERTHEEELVEDVLSIITVFSARLYGSRSHKAKQIDSVVKKAFSEK